MDDKDAADSIRETLTTLFNLVETHQGSALFSVVGLILLGLTGLLAFRTLKQQPEERSQWSVYAIFVSLVCGVVFSFAGPLFALVEVKKEFNRQFVKLDAAQAMKNLHANAKVPRVVRLIAYDPATESHLGIGGLMKSGKLGKPYDRFIFVADYNELQGYTAYEAVQKLGGEITDNDHVSAIIFPVDSQSYPKNEEGTSRIQLYPANARGLIHVIERLEKENEHLPPGKDFVSFKGVLNKELSAGEREEIQKKNGRSDWSWEEYKKSYPKYCKIVQQFRCDAPFGAKKLIGEISKDWHPLGFSRLHPDEPCTQEKTNEFCNINEWEDTERLKLKENFGVRVFLTHNFPISELRNHMLIHFNSPKTQIIPYIGER
jgi:hypothetical protein